MTSFFGDRLKSSGAYKGVVLHGGILAQVAQITPARPTYSLSVWPIGNLLRRCLPLRSTPQYVRPGIKCEGQLAGRSGPDISRSTRRKILPLADLGMTSRNCTSLMCLKAAMSALTVHITSSAVKPSCPACRTTYALGTYRRCGGSNAASN